MANAAATLMGQNLGANQPDRAEKSVWKTAFYNMIFLLLVGLLFLGFAENFISIFNNNPKVVEVGVLCLQIMSAGYLFSAMAWSSDRRSMVLAILEPQRL
jgi:Na+-driven multidrug efflux pump